MDTLEHTIEQTAKRLNKIIYEAEKLKETTDEQRYLMPLQAKIDGLKLALHIMINEADAARRIARGDQFSLDTTTGVMTPIYPEAGPMPGR